MPAWHGLYAPLNLAAYAVLALIAFNQTSTGMAASKGPLVLFGCGLSLTVFLLAFIGRELVEHGPSARTRVWLMLVIQAVAALANLALIYDGTNPILLVLIAAQLPAFASMSMSAVVLAVLNIAVYFFLRDVHAQARPLFNIAIYSTFQAFAMLTAHFVFRAEQANRDLQAMNAHLLATRGLLEEGARDGERLRLSRELHDVAGHALTALKLHLELAQRLPDDVQRRARIESARVLADSLLDDIRGVVSQLRRHDGVDLPAVLSTLCHGFPGIDVRLDVEPTLRIADVERAETVVRSVQEALTNAVRHGGARQIDVRLERSVDDVLVRIGDDGRGTRQPRFGNGLTGVRERLAQFGGRMRIQTQPGKGFTLELALPDPPVSAA